MKGGKFKRKIINFEKNSIHTYYVIFQFFFFRQDPPRIDRTPTRIKPKFKIHDEFKTDWLKFDIGKKEIFVIIYFVISKNDFYFNFI